MRQLMKSYCFALCLSMSVSPVHAAQRTAAGFPDNYWQKNWSCGTALKPDQRLVKMLMRHQGLHSVVVENKTLPILVGHDLEKLGTVLFIQQQNGRWIMLPMAQGERLQGISSTSSAYNMMFFSMWMVEGAGNRYTLLRTRKGQTEFDCQAIPFPKTLNTPAWANEFLDLLDVNINDKGEGVLLGVAGLERNGKTVQQWYQYTTHDWGRTWSQPTMVQPPIKTPQGVFHPAIEIPAKKALVDSLLRGSR